MHPSVARHSLEPSNHREMSDRLEQDGVSGCGFTQVLQLDLEDDAFLTSTFKRDTGSLSQTLTFAGIG